ncbi:hypothetical protein RP20_CCG021671 [Aedes albopictus]|nr:hypothetical protein RP20_CCG021671 [Aedes albopictus]
MNKSKREPNVRNPGSYSKSGKSFDRRNRKSGKAGKEQGSPPDEESADLKLKRMTNGGVVNRTNQMKSKQKVGGMKLNEKMPRKDLVQKHDRNAPKPMKSQPAPPPKSNSNKQKRKAPDSNGFGTKSKKAKKHSLPESDSDADDYLDQFFEDASDDEVNDPGVPSSDGNSEEEDDDDLTESSSEDSDDDDDEDDNQMSLEELVEYFGHRKDERAANKRKQSKKVQPQSQGSNGWVEEDNDVELVYKDSDDEVDVSSRALVPVGDVRTVQYVNDTDDDDDEDESTEEEYEDEDDDEPFDLEAYMRGELDFGEDTDSSDDDDDDGENEFTNSDSFEEDSEAEYSEDSFAEEEEEEEESELDDHEFSSDYDSDEDDSDDDDSDLPSYWDESYDSEDDEDYVAEEDDDLYICRGTARVYNIDENEVSFNSDVETAQIVELPLDDRRRGSAGESQDDDINDGGCPILVPIYDAQGNLIDRPEKLKKLSLNDAKNPEVVRTAATEEVVDNEMEEEVEQSSVNQSSYRFYDAIDMRLSLLVLKNTLYFSGHLTIQPLVGGLEVMGYNLSPGECRSAFAVRGFHSLNLTPRPQSAPSSKDAMGKVIARLEKHFHDADLRNLLKTFDYSDSVLVLLQADSNNKRIDTVDKYLSEDFLFPKVEYMKKSEFYRTEYLLNAEFFSEHVDKGTSLYRPDPEWDKIVAKNNSRIVVIGGKGSGKSTLCQYLINKNVEKFKKVVLIDLDIGQPIQHVPETISVTIVDKPFLGVATLNPIPPVKSWLFGSLDIVSSLIFYTQNVRQLLRYCEQHKSEFGNVPWIVNTMGYVSDFGEELMTTILRMLSPTDVVQLVSTDKLHAIPNYQNRFTSEFVNRYSHNILRSEVQEYIKRKASFKHYELNVCYPKKGFTLNAPKRRNMMLLAHLADILQDSSSEWFNEVKPFCAPLGQLQVLVTREDQTLDEDQLPSVLNATLVYLCRKDDAGLYECLGIGIVRGVDKNNNVYLLQSLPDARLAEVNVLAICSSSLPNAVFLRQSARIQGTIPYVYNID